MELLLNSGRRYDSDPADEERETELKASAFLDAINRFGKRILLVAVLLAREEQRRLARIGKAS